MNLVERINVLYPWVCGTCGDRSKAPTGESYRTYAIGLKPKECDGWTMETIRDELEMMLYATFTILRSPCAPDNVQGAPVSYESVKSHWRLPLRDRYLYWRSYPEIEFYGDIMYIRCRALVSATKQEPSYDQ